MYHVLGKVFMLKFLSLFLALTLSFLVRADNSIPDKLVEVSLFSFKDSKNNYLAVAFKNAPHWHTYWSNPGDAGLPTKIKITGLETKELAWPVPSQYKEDGDIQVFGYGDQYTRFFKLPASLEKKKSLTIQSNWLVCKHICIPGSFNQTFNLSPSYSISGYKNPFSLSKETLVRQLKKLPKEQATPSNLNLELVRDGEGDLRLHAQIQNVKKQKEKTAFFFPYRHPLLTFKREKSSFKEDSYNVFYSLEWDGIYEEPPIELPKVGKLPQSLEVKLLYFAPNSEQPIIIKKTFSELKPLTLALSAVKKSTNSSGELQVLNRKEQGSSLFVYLILAFIGGIILNVMPCVLPVISIKLFNLAAHSDESRKMIFKHNLSYTIGVLLSFSVLALIVVLLKTTGESVGWGFQLQSPHFVAFMVIILTIFAFNLFGLFEFRTPGGRVLGNVQIKEGFIGDFLSGVLATILSTPCSAPFLGTALTFAFSGSSILIFCIFLSIGLGLSFPFILTAFFPQAVRALPRPGLWMEKVKKILGFTLILTVIWLLDVFEMQTIQGSLFKLLGVLSFFFFAFYFQAHISKSKWKYFFHLIPLSLAAVILFQSDLTKVQSNQSSFLERKKSKGLGWEKWSEEKTQEYAANRQPTFIDFTANWCLTCKVNEKLVLETKKFKELIKEHDVKLLLGDWTRNDPKISAFLNKHGFVGVPAYFVINKKGQLVILGETISVKEIKDALLN